MIAPQPISDELEGHWIAEKCPRCGCSMLGNARGDKWCSFVGGRQEPACSYGLDDSNPGPSPLTPIPADA